MKTRSERLSAWARDLTPLSAGVLALGAGAIVVAIPGTILFVVVQGLTPFESIVSSMTSPFQASLMYIAIALGAVAALAGYSLFRQMPTKAARESMLGGAALGVQAVLFALAFLWFSSGELFPIFIRSFFSFDVLGEFMDTFLRAARNTLILAFFAQLIGMVLGAVFALMALSDRVVVRAPARLYINFIRGTPLLVQLSMGYLGIVLGLGLDVSVYEAGIVILGLNAGAYTAEIFRAGIQSIDRGQLEAARSLGMSYLQAMRYVVMPQAIRRVIPPLTNEFVILIKDTSLIAFLGFTFGDRELLAWASDSYADSFNATPFLAAVLGYLAITLPLIRLVTALERKLRSGLVGIGA
jgi:His/Glu/Gln/Arg/opine family amino acid ABC transporter permease subunit